MEPEGVDGGDRGRTHGAGRGAPNSEPNPRRRTRALLSRRATTGRLAADALQKVCDRIGQVVAAELAGAVEGFARTGAMGPIRAVGTGARDEPKREIQIVDGTYLVGPEEEAVFFSRLEDAMVPFPGLHADCSGPWPPYSFVRLRPEPVEETR